MKCDCYLKFQHSSCMQSLLNCMHLNFHILQMLMNNDGVYNCRISFLNSFFPHLQINTVTFPTRSKFSWSASCHIPQSARFYILPASSVCFCCIYKLPQSTILYYSISYGFLTNTSCYHVCRYIFDRKESKQTDSKGKEAKDAKGEKASQERVIARLQVSVNCICILRF